MELPLLPHLLLAATFTLLWLGPLRRLWPLLLLAALAAALWQGVITLAALAAIALLGLLCLGWRRFQKDGQPLLPRLAFALLLPVTVLALALHLFPGFAPVTALEEVVLSPSSPPFSINYHYDKALAGLLLLALCAPPLLQGREWLPVLRRTLPIWLATFAAVAGVMMLAGYLRPDPKWHGAFLWWALGNLFFTCVAEETFFRLLIQSPLQRLLGPGRAMAWLAIVITALLFGLAHGGAGWPMVAAATLAGIGYGWAFYRTGRIEAAILVHFGVNAAHFLLLTYPLAR